LVDICVPGGTFAANAASSGRIQMPYWLSIALALASWIWALMQTRMIFVYRGKVDSPTTGFYRGGDPNVVMSSIAVRSAATFTVFGFLFLVVAWPRVLTYVTAVWFCRAIVNAVLYWLGRGQYSVTASSMTDKGRTNYVFQELAKVIGNGVWFGGCVYFFGF